MKIKTQLIVSTIILAAILVVCLVSVIVSNQRLLRIARQQELARSIQQDINELGFITNSYLIFRDQSQLTLWESKNDSISNELAALKASNQQQQNLVDNIQLNQQRLISVFTDVKNNIASNPATSQNLDYIGTAYSRLSVQTQGIAANSNQLSQLLQTQSDRIKQNNNQLILFLFVVFGLLVLTNFLLINRRVMRGLSSLEAGARVIGSGNLDHFVPVKSNDEIGEVSIAFNQMTSDLKTVTASKADLEKEIKERKQAEEKLLNTSEELKAANEELRQTTEELQTTNEELRLREKEYRSLAENIPDIVTRYDKHLRHIFVNQAASQAAGIPVEAFIGKTNLELGQDPHQIEYWMKYIRRVFASGKAETMEFEWEAPDGLRFQQTIITPEFDVDGSVKTVLCITHNITEIKRTEEALQRYTRELETYRNNLEDLVNQRTQELQSLSYRLINAQEDEKRNISRELHDQTGQSLTVLNLLLAKAIRSPETILTDIKEAQQTVKEVLSQVRGLSTSLHPGMLEDLGLLPTLQWYFNDFDKKTGININFAHSGLERNLPAEINITVYRIIQEALTNIARYAEVKEATVALELEHQVLFIQIEDKGKGFDVESQQRGVGLRGMKERVNALKGNLKIHSVPGEGTLIEAALPVKPE